VQQHVDALAGNRAADVQKLGVARRSRAEQARGFNVGGGLSVRRTARVRAVRHDRAAIGSDSSPGYERVPRGVAVAGNMSRLAQPGQDVTRHRTEYRRSALQRWIENTAEGIEIVARHDRPFRRQTMHEMRVAVIDDVKHIEVIPLLTQLARIIPEAPGQPVSQVRAAASTYHRQSRPAPRHRRT